MYNLYVSLKQTRLASISTKTFKGWLIAFTIIAPFVLVIVMMALSLIGFLTIIAKSQNGRNPRPLYQLEASTSAMTTNADMNAHDTSADGRFGPSVQ